MFCLLKQWKLNVLLFNFAMLTKSGLANHPEENSVKFGFKPFTWVKEAKISSFKNPRIKIDLLTRGQNPLSYYILYNESEHNGLALVGKRILFYSWLTAGTYSRNLLIEFFFAKYGEFGLLFNEKSFIEVEKKKLFWLKKRKSAKNPNHWF